MICCLYVCTDITGIFLPLICRNMEAIFMLYYMIFILLGDLCEVKFSGRIIPVMSVCLGCPQLVTYYSDLLSNLHPKWRNFRQKYRASK